MTLANIYRPTEFSDVVSQPVVCKILNKQIETKSYSNALLFEGSAGSGKTTCARIFANKINGEIIEIDCASHNGVAEIKDILENARVPSLVNEYKLFILDECHTLTPQAWASMLITLEETLPKTIFVFCTTDPQKIPKTIISRVQEFKFVPISEDDIINRLKFVCDKESITIEEDAITTIAKAAKGSLRQALTYLDKCTLYDDNLTNTNVCKTLNIVSNGIMKDLLTVYERKDITSIIDIVTQIYSNGYELHDFMRQFLDFALTTTNIKLIDCILKIINDIRYDDNPKNLIIANLICF